MPWHGRPAREQDLGRQLRPYLWHRMREVRSDSARSVRPVPHIRVMDHQFTCSPRRLMLII